ncbi:DEAD/DEAH box helicase [Streptomyces sp. NPDC058228]|uniref:DEAD/DEAH box helicase n=1 Tax=Streptomyces sp. NPDC058228 TaxID=3346390 RepID=UPI0036E7FC28
MDRTVDRDVLAWAMGEYREGMMPSPEELVSLISDVEIAAVRVAHFELPDELLRTAWYLHGVAAAAPDSDEYDLVRLRHAFAVSAHVFDLALASEDRSDSDRLRLAFAAQAGYRRCEQDPNATAVFHQVRHLVITDTDLPAHIDTVAIEAGVAFLGMSRTVLTHALRVWRQQFDELRRLTRRDSMRGTMYGPAEAVVDAVHHLHRHLVFGGGNNLERARASLWSVVDHSAGSGDLWARWVASHLLELTGELAASSLYALLPPGTPPAVARTFALSEPPVMTLWPPQRKLLQLEAGNPLDPATRRSLISVPTSAGKTLMAQLVICSHLAQEPGRVVYVSPLRSLGREMREALRGRLRLLGRRLTAEQPDFPAGDQGRGTAEDVEILTPERLMHALRNDPEAALNGVGLIVVDEAHHLAQAQRGFLLEGLLAYCQVHPANPRLVLLSAAVGNRAVLASWLDPERPEAEVVFTDHWRGPRRLHGLISPTLLREDVVRKSRKASKDRPGLTRATVPVAARLSLRPTANAEPAVMVTKGLGVRHYAEETPGSWTINSRLSGGIPDIKLFALTAAHLTRAGSVLMIGSTQQEARNTALAIAEHLEDRPEAAPLADYFAHTLGSEHPLVSCARKGVAYHHASLPDDVLHAIEDALRAGKIVAVTATSTLTDGVNLPVRTVIINSRVGNDRLAYEAQQRLTSAQLLNAVGRAGRAGRESEGWIFLTRHSTARPKSADFDLMAPGDDALEVTSALIDSEVLEELAACEELIRSSTDAIFELAGTLVADFVAYVWFTLDALSRIPTLTDTDPLLAVRRLLAMQQLDPDVRAQWLALATTVAERYRLTDSAARRRWTTPGTSIGTARTLDRIAQRIALPLITGAVPRSGEDPLIHIPTLTEVWPLHDTLAYLADHRVLDELLALPEVVKANAWNFTSKATKGEAVDVPLNSAVRSWLSGIPIPDLATLWLPQSSREWALEQAVANISRTFEHALSWTLGALINLVNGRITAAGSPIRLCTDTAWYLRHGVDTEHALHLLTSGITSRRLAHQIGRLAQEESISIAELRPWLTSLHIDGWLTLFDASEYEVADLLEYVRSRSGSLLNTVLEGGPARLKVTLIDGSSAPSGPVVIGHLDGSSALVLVLQGQPVAIIPASSHSDVAALLDSNLDTELALSGDEFTIRLSVSAYL